MSSSAAAVDAFGEHSITKSQRTGGSAIGGRGKSGDFVPSANDNPISIRRLPGTEVSPHEFIILFGEIAQLTQARANNGTSMQVSVPNLRGQCDCQQWPQPRRVR